MIRAELSTETLFNDFYHDFVLLGSEIIDGPEIHFDEHCLTSMLAVFMELADRSGVQLEDITSPIQSGNSINILPGKSS